MHGKIIGQTTKDLTMAQVNVRNKKDESPINQMYNDPLQTKHTELYRLNCNRRKDSRSGKIMQKRIK